jgi:ectoine hydroxylase-related dioxygenase (phytanoyl-CoA dioxygenase family)
MAKKSQLEELKENGYTLVPNLISDEECERFKGLLEEDHKRYSNFYEGASAAPEGALANKSGEKVVFNLHNRDLSWFKLFEKPEILLLLDNVLKKGSYNNDEPYYLNNISARCPLKGFDGQQLHLDSNLPGVNYCIAVNVLWMLDDFTLDNGATRVVPGSHKWTSYAPDGIQHKDEIRITGNKGSALVFNANLWHGGANNTTDESRWGVALGYVRWFIKPSFDFMQNTPKSIYNKLTDKQKDLLGFRLIPPKDEFTRLHRKSLFFETPLEYHLPKTDLKKSIEN